MSYDEISKLKGSSYRVFFQNAEGNINMGVLFNDPDVDMDEILWYSQLSSHMQTEMRKNKELISVDEELKTHSCYVELHSKVAKVYTRF